MAWTNLDCGCYPSCDCGPRPPCHLTLTTRQVRRENEGRNTGVGCSCLPRGGKLGFARDLSEVRKVFQVHLGTMK